MLWLLNANVVATECCGCWTMRCGCSQLNAVVSPNSLSYGCSKSKSVSALILILKSVHVSVGNPSGARQRSRAPIGVLKRTWSSKSTGMRILKRTSLCWMEQVELNEANLSWIKMQPICSICIFHLTLRYPNAARASARMILCTAQEMQFSLLTQCCQSQSEIIV